FVRGSCRGTTEHCLMPSLRWELQAPESAFALALPAGHAPHFETPVAWLELNSSRVAPDPALPPDGYCLWPGCSPPAPERLSVAEPEPPLRAPTPIVL